MVPSGTQTCHWPIRPIESLSALSHSYVVWVVCTAVAVLFSLHAPFTFARIFLFVTPPVRREVENILIVQE